MIPTHPLMAPELMALRHAELLREAHAERVTAVARRATDGRTDRSPRALGASSAWTGGWIQAARDAVGIPGRRADCPTC